MMKGIKYIAISTIVILSVLLAYNNFDSIFKWQKEQVFIRYSPESMVSKDPTKGFSFWINPYEEVFFETVKTKVLSYNDASKIKFTSIDSALTKIPDVYVRIDKSNPSLEDYEFYIVTIDSLKKSALQITVKPRYIQYE